MPKKQDCYSDDEYIVYSCDSEISSYLVSVSDTDCCDSSLKTCESIKCKNDSCSSSKYSSRCSCCPSSSSRCCTDSDDYHCPSTYCGHGGACAPAPRFVPATTAQLPMVRNGLSAPAIRAQDNIGQGPLGTSIPAPATTLSQTPTPATTTTMVTTDDGETMMMITPSAVPEPRRRSFRAAVTPLIDLKTPSSPLNTGGVSFTMRRRNDTVCMQWEPFAATIAANGVSHLNVGQSISCLPPHAVHVPYSFRLNGVGKIGFVRIDPNDSSANIKLSLDQDDRNVANAGDTFETSGGVVCWICSY